MADLWPWFALAGLGALHGSSPANGWMFAAACGVRAQDRAQVWPVLQPIAIGHTASIAIVACGVAQGMVMDRALVQGLAGALLVAAAVVRVWRGARPGMALRMRGGHAGIALWSFLMGTAQGAGLMLVPALVPLCMTDTPAREITASGSLGLAAAAVVVHMAAMLLTTGVIASGVCRGVARLPRVHGAKLPRHLWTAALAVTGGLLVALR